MDKWQTEEAKAFLRDDTEDLTTILDLYGNLKWAQLWVVAHPDITPELLERLSEIGDSTVISTVLANPKTPTTVLEKFYNWSDDFYHLSLAGNPSTPAVVLSHIYHHHSSGLGVKSHVLFNPNAPIEVLIDFFYKQPNEDPTLFPRMVTRRATVKSEIKTFTKKLIPEMDIENYPFEWVDQLLKEYYLNS